MQEILSYYRAKKVLTKANHAAALKPLKNIINRYKQIVLKLVAYGIKGWAVKDNFLSTQLYNTSNRLHTLNLC